MIQYTGTYQENPKSMISCEMIKIVDSFLEKYMEDSEINNICHGPISIQTRLSKKYISSNSILLQKVT